jgi:hypothetical protein
MNNLTLWQEIRSDWVNGNRSDAKEKLYQSSKHKMLKAILEAANSYHESLSGSGFTHSGDLQDLREILTSLTRGGNNK